MTLSFDPEKVHLPRGHFIEGRFVEGGEDIAIRRPSDGMRHAFCSIADADMVDRAITSAARAQRISGWADSPPRDRARALHRWADLIQQNATELARIEAVGSTRPIAEVVANDIPVSIEQLRFFAEFADKECGDVAPTAAGSLGMVLTEPYGVVAAITPWNFPLSMAVWKIAPALAAGNSVVIKPSEFTPFSTLFIADLAARAGLPSGILNVISGNGPETGTAMTCHPAVGKMSFTGSTEAGRAIIRNTGLSRVRPLTLELGGKSPQIVFADADLDHAAACVANSILANGGQACVAGSRLLVQQEIAAPLFEAIRRRMQDVVPGPTWNAATIFSPIISERQILRIGKIVDDAVAEGAEILCGGGPFDRSGYYFRPTLLAGVDENSPAVMQEIFGPVLTLQTFEDEDEAVTLADHPDYGLAAGLFTNDVSRALRVTKRLKTGTVWVNRYGRSRDHILPTGGYGNSGIGKDLGRQAYVANLRSKSVLFDIGPSPKATCPAPHGTRPPKSTAARPDTGG